MEAKHTTTYRGFELRRNPNGTFRPYRNNLEESSFDHGSEEGAKRAVDRILAGESRDRELVRRHPDLESRKVYKVSYWAWPSCPPSTVAFSILENDHPIGTLLIYLESPPRARFLFSRPVDRKPVSASVRRRLIKEARKWIAKAPEGL